MKIFCPECGAPGFAGTKCFKCDTLLYTDALYEIDVAHREESVQEAMYLIQDALYECRFLRYKGLKIIHGYGSRAGHTSIIRDHLKPWLTRISKQYGAKMVQDKRNPGAHILYFHTGRREQ